MFHDQNIITWPLIRLRALRTGNKEHRYNVSINSGNIYNPGGFYVYWPVYVGTFLYRKSDFFFNFFLVGGGGRGGIFCHIVTFNLSTKICKPKIVKFVLDFIDT